MMRNKRDFVSVAKIVGKVTAVDEELCTFRLNNHKTVNVAHMGYKNDCFNFPELGQEVSITNPHCVADEVLYLCKKSGLVVLKPDIENVDPNKLNSDNTIRKSSSTHIFNLILDHKIGIPDLIIIESFCNKFRTTALLKTDKANLPPKELAQAVVCSLINKYQFSSQLPQQSCKNQVLPKCRLLSPSDLRYIDIQTNKYTDFIYWSFGIHPNAEKEELLIGFLFVHRSYGVPMIQDVKHMMMCLIVDPDQNLKDYLNCCVIIKKFTIITEIYQEANIPNLEYCLFNIKDVQIIERVQQELIIHPSYIILSNKFEYAIVFYLKQKSLTKLTRQNQSEYWLQIDIIKSEGTKLDGSIFLIVSSNHLQLVPYLQLGRAYRLYYNKTLTCQSNIELKKFFPSCPQYLLSDRSAVFQFEDTIEPIEHTQHIMTVRECKSHIERFPDQMVSFQGKLKIRKFTDPIGSRTQRNASVYGFGTPGKKTHLVEFAVEDSEVKTLVVYLNNWEGSLLPCGLILEMRIRVNNVMAQKGKYLKSTAMTSFEILQYEPAVAFTTANLYTEITDVDWGRPFYFGLGKKIPYGVLVTGNILRIQVKSLKISTTCLGCNQVTELIDCKCSNTYKFDVLITLFVYDLFGTATIISKSEELLRCILDLRPHEFKLWCSEFRNVGSYEYYCNSSYDGRDIFCKVLTDLLTTINEVGIVQMELCCRKLDNRGNTNPNIPVWWCIKARRF